jgi:hypothetical protein
MPTAQNLITGENTLTGNTTLHRGTDLMQWRLSDTRTGGHFELVNVSIFICQYYGSQTGFRETVGTISKSSDLIQRISK